MGGGETSTRSWLPLRAELRTSGGLMLRSLFSSKKRGTFQVPSPHAPHLGNPQGSCPTSHLPALTPSRPLRWGCIGEKGEGYQKASLATLWMFNWKTGPGFELMT